MKSPTRIQSRTALAAFTVAAFLGAATLGTARAEVGEVRFVDQPGLLYLPLHVVVAEKLVEKHAKKAGLGDVKTSLVTLSGGAAVNQALLSGSVDFAAGGTAPLLTIWDKTKGSDDVKAAVDLARMPLKLVTNDKSVRKVEDYAKVTDHKIATPSVSSIQAVTLRMVSGQLWGDPGKLDPLLVNMRHPDAVVALLSGGQTVKSHFATLPYSYTLLRSGKTHLVLSSYDVVGGAHSTIALYNTTRWKTANPKLFNAVVEAYKEAMDYIYADTTRAAEFFIKHSKSKLKPEDVKAIISDKNEIEYSVTPKNTMFYAKFLHKIGTIKNLPSSWKDYYFESSHSFDGS